MEYVESNEVVNGRLYQCVVAVTEELSWSEARKRYLIDSRECDARAWSHLMAQDKEAEQRSSRSS